MSTIPKIDVNYIPAPVTQSEDAKNRYLTNEFRKIQQAISSLTQAINKLIDIENSGS
jgi:hypothetical protein